MEVFFNKQYQLQTFKGQNSPLLKILMGKTNPMLTATKSHRENVYFNTSINSRLRNPVGGLIDETNSKTMKLLSLQGKSTIYSGLGWYNYKEAINEDIQLMKKRLNDEFKLLPKTKKKQTYYRGIVDISDNQYNEFKDFTFGQEVVPDKGFAYITKTKNEAELYLKGNSNKVLFEIEIPKGSQISELEAIMPPKNPNFPIPEVKNESVVPAGSVYEVTRPSIIDDSGILHVYLKFLNKY